MPSVVGTETDHNTWITTLLFARNVWVLLSPSIEGSKDWTYGITSLSEKTQRSNHLQILEQRHHLLLNYFKTLSIGPAGPTYKWRPPVVTVGASWKQAYFRLFEEMYMRQFIQFNSCQFLDFHSFVIHLARSVWCSGRSSFSKCYSRTAVLG